MVKKLLLSLGLLLFVASPALASQQNNNNNNEDKVTICHRTNSVTNPYEKITVDENSITKEHGHGDHTGPIATSEETAQTLKDAKTKWGDIIPPFGEFAGLNWTTVGQEILRNDCKVPEKDPPKDVCPNIDGVQTEVPTGKQLNSDGQCVDIPTPPVTPPTTIVTTPTSLPNTGGGFEFLLLGLGSSGLGAVMKYALRKG